MARGQKEVFEALRLFEKEKGISRDYMIEKINKAIVNACRNTYLNENVILEFDDNKETFNAFLEKTVVEKVENEGREISLEDAKKIKKKVNVGDKLKVQINTREFGRISVTTARSIIRQAVRDGEKEVLKQEYEQMCGSLVTGVIEQIDKRTGNATLKVGNSWIILPKQEQIKDEVLKEGDYIQVYMIDVKATEKGPKAIISRNHTGLVKKLFEKEIPEIADGTIEIKAIAREAGARTKVAVFSNNKEVDAIGTCIGQSGTRINSIMKAINSEKIDLIEYSDDIKEFIGASIAPANAAEVKITSEEDKTCEVKVPDHQISLAIGNKGQNVRLAARLTGWKIDIVPESGYYTGLPEDEPEIIK